MTREIKFRAWDKKVDHRMWSLIELRNLPLGDLERKDLEWLQFTGLHDKNGKEIYEGDVVFFRDRNITEDIHLPVKYIEGEWLMDDGNWKLYLADRHSGVEIIGNIYENPELI